ncbi:hypothetical protein NIES593_12210 [Hydrococcus rivularis NIES-593]|uniref:DUF3110 domain-containing protein n=1 Tax=Hydrococcus rivularis NIES-593 TaxID=1921803 RepID=A0A1U7HG41_9CYAN|nr:DUF3110 domain-containing protein [Hydrococcus rivularis]OKH22553.1 hypothetical protein NIES593_12210 [Hydrococcus rivularis NIES-593]
MRVFVLLFNARTENEGIHTIQIGDRNKVLMFESEDDATRYALLLEAQDFPAPTVEAIDSEEIEEFCRSADYDWEIVKDGMLAIPPDKNVENTDWKPDGNYSEPETATETETGTETDSEMSPSELESIRRRLEGLL